MALRVVPSRHRIHFFLFIFFLFFILSIVIMFQWFSCRMFSGLRGEPRGGMTSRYIALQGQPIAQPFCRGFKFTNPQRHSERIGTISTPIAGWDRHLAAPSVFSGFLSNQPTAYPPLGERRLRDRMYMLCETGYEFLIIEYRLTVDHYKVTQGSANGAGSLPFLLLSVCAILEFLYSPHLAGILREIDTPAWKHAIGRNAAHSRFLFSGWYGPRACAARDTRDESAPYTVRHCFS